MLKSDRSVAENIENASDPTQEVGSDRVTISVPRHLAPAVQEFVRQLESDGEDTRAHMLGLLTTTTSRTSTSTAKTSKGVHVPAHLPAEDDWDTSGG